MSLLDLLFGNAASRKKPAATVIRSSTQASTSPAATRRELVRVVLRDTLRTHGIPSDWIGLETLTVTSREGKAGLHARLLIKHWEPRLLPFCVALQVSLQTRMTVFDPLADNWFAGLSWQFAVPDTSVCPPLPEPGFWKAAPVVPAAAAAATPAPAPEPPAAVLDAQPSPLLQHSQDTAQARREALERLLAEGDRQHITSAEAAQRAFRPTEPAGLV